MKKNSTGVGIKEIVIENISRIQDEGTFDESFDDDFVIRAKDIQVESGFQSKSGSLVFEDSAPGSGSSNDRCWERIGNVKLMASSSDFNDQFSFRIAEKKVISKLNNTKVKTVLIIG